MKHLVLYVNQNSPGKKDGDEFQREAIAYAEYHTGRGDEVISIPVPCQVPARRRPQVVEENIEQAGNKFGPFDVFSYFGHGTERWIQTGHTLQKLEEFDDFIGVLADVLVPKPTLWWAACRTAADNPRPKDAHSGAGILEEAVEILSVDADKEVTAWGHTTAGHTTRNPNLRIFTPKATHHLSDSGKQQVKNALWAPNSTLRFEIPLCHSLRELLERIK